MENGKQPAFASTDGKTFANDGLTKREYFAAMAMQGCLSRIAQGYGKPHVNEASMEDSLKREQEFIDDVAIKSVRYSDALLRALDNSKSE